MFTSEVSKNTNPNRSVNDIFYDMVEVVFIVIESFLDVDKDVALVFADPGPRSISISTSLSVCNKTLTPPSEESNRVRIANNPTQHPLVLLTGSEVQSCILLKKLANEVLTP